MKKQRIEDVQELREIQMRILDRIDIFCKENNLDYSISSGTLLGAVRHQGYIPWDDDIDIYMPRKSYSKFLKLWKNDVDQYHIDDKFHNSKYPYSYSKIIDVNTILIEDSFPDYQTGVWVDVFPIDGIPDNKYIASLFLFAKKVFNSIIWYRNFDHQKTIKSKLYRYIPISTISLLKYREALFSLCKKSQRVMNLTESGPSSVLKAFQRSDMDEYITLDFENRKYKAMCGFSNYLTQTYGEYMILPPVDKRVRHNFSAYKYLNDENC